MLCHYSSFCGEHRKIVTVNVRKFRHKLPAKKVKTNRTDPDQTASEEQSDQGLPCMLFGQVFCEFKP